MNKEIKIKFCGFKLSMIFKRALEEWGGEVTCEVLLKLKLM